MDILGFDPLSVLIVLPALGAVLVASLPAKEWLVRWTALLIALLITAISVGVWQEYQVLAAATGDQFVMVVEVQWFALDMLKVEQGIVD